MRLRLIFGVVVVVWIILLVRIYYLSINFNEYYAEIAEDNVIKTKLIAPVRGQILDTKSRPLAVNNLGFSISIAPHLSEKNGLNDEISYIVSLFNDLNATKITKEYTKQNSPYNQNFIKVVEFLDYNQTIPHFAALNLRSNLKIEPSSQRHYPYGSLASHVIGYVGRASIKDIERVPLSKLTGYIGRSGVEGYYNSVLQGNSGARKTKVTALNNVVEEISYTPPSSHDISLTIDLELQQYIEDIFGESSGAAVVMDLSDGAIIAAGSFPEYDLNPFVTGISFEQWDALINDLNHPFTNKLVNGLYPPGSVIKMGVAMSFLDSGKMDRNSGFYCSGSMELGGRKFRCWRTWGHGFMGLNDAIRESCDDYFYKGSLEVGIDHMAAYLEKLGLGAKTGIDLPNEFVGTIPNKAWKMDKYNKPWYNGETVITSIGQGNMLVTPVQIAKYTAQIAISKGITPHFIKSIDGNKSEFKLTEIFTPAEKSWLIDIRKAMFEVANHKKGTANKALGNNAIKIAAKTGTAQVVGIPQSEKVRMKEQDMEYYQRSHAWITSYGPYEKPRFVVSVLVEHGGSGSSTAGPIVNKIYSKLVQMGYIEAPSEDKTDKK